MHPDEILRSFENNSSSVTSKNKFKFRFPHINKRSTVGFLVLALAVTSIFLSQRLIKPVGEAERSKAANTDVKVSETPTVNITGSQKARVLIQLSGDVKVEASLSTLSASKQRSKIKSTQDLVKSTLKGTKSKILSEYPSIPFISAELDAEGLSRLRGLSDTVVAIVPDVASKARLRDTRLIIGASKYELPVDKGGSNYNGLGIVVAVLDSGVDTSHVFLKNKVIREICFTHCPNGADFQDGAGAATPCTWNSECNHGTLVAGVVAGEGTGEGGISSDYAGIAKKTTILSAQVATPVNCRNDDNNPSTPDVCDMSYFNSSLVGALSWIYEHRSDYYFGAINMSVGSDPYDRYCDGDVASLAYSYVVNNLKQAGIPVVVSSGNGGIVGKIESPGCVSTIIPVGATRKDDTVSYLSDVATFHSNFLMAPGEAVLSSNLNNTMLSVTGTSISAPHVAAAYAILEQVKPGATVDERTDALKKTAKMIPDNRPGGGGTLYPRIQIDKAIEALLGGTPVSFCSSTSGELPCTTGSL